MVKRKEINKLEKPTLETIARMVGVHKSTVSRVLNRAKNDGKVLIGDKRSKEIIAIARKLNYRPNVLARALSMKKTKTIGAVGYLNSPYFYSMLLHAQKEAFEHGYILSVHGIDNKSIDKALEEMFDLWQYDGILAVGSYPEYQKPIVKACARRKIPLVFIGQPLGCKNAENVCCIGGDLEEGFTRVIHRLCCLGHGRYVWFLPDLGKNELAALYYKSIRAALRKKNISPKNSTFVDITQDLHKTRAICKKYFVGLKKDLPRSKWPTAAIAIFQTVGTLKGIRDAGLLVPEEISFVTVDYSIETYGDALQLPVAVMYEPNKLFGKSSIEALMQMMKCVPGKTVPFKNITLPMIFNENESCRSLETLQQNKA